MTQDNVTATFGSSAEAQHPATKEGAISLIRRLKAEGKPYTIDQLLNAAKLAIFMSVTKSLQKHNEHAQQAGQYITEALELDPMNQRALLLAADWHRDDGRDRESLQSTMTAIYANKGTLTSEIMAELGKTYEGMVRAMFLATTITEPETRPANYNNVAIGYAKLALGSYMMAVDCATNDSKARYQTMLKKFEHFTGLDASIENMELALIDVQSAVNDIENTQKALNARSVAIEALPA